MQRAFWIAQVGVAFLDLMDPAVPLLAWDGWDEESAASQRYSNRFDEAMTRRSSDGA
ncbi:hypothetical protein [Streptacidiphilus sp. P02-A3a]|uniref:hypothetical protein n=1 Tax=Streptacidiphilus sp. P02-A3a TaxID=2704468 RepID=UPI0015FE65C0|nr:hypothetical protein [Streptacidiphilus sp. P02-A3a]QMU69916.1 hypothetical protein GXP74_18520 [Streptacidiphilus sp. P02-A3a]